MRRMDVKCPACGTINYGLDLTETDGWMECAHCGCTARLISLRGGDATVAGNCRWQILRPLPDSRSFRAVGSHG